MKGFFLVQSMLLLLLQHPHPGGKISHVPCVQALLQTAAAAGAWLEKRTQERNSHLSY